jgi:uncharacterized protein YdeI (YjbR/CyaY-like superfamily)
MPVSRPAIRTFEATLEHSGNTLNWIIIRIPFDAEKLWGKRGQIKVKGEINGFEFRSSLFPTGQGTHYMIVNKKMQAGGKTAPGARARFRMEPDTAKREMTVPKEWQAMLAQSKALQKFHASLNSSTRTWIARWIQEAKQSATRTRRSEQMAERLMETMEAERDLPPLIRQALARNPKAHAGWQRMPVSHRRSHLLGIFGYRNPESRARRIEKAVKEMVAYAKKPAKGSHELHE